MIFNIRQHLNLQFLHVVSGFHAISNCDFDAIFVVFDVLGSFLAIPLKYLLTSLCFPSSFDINNEMANLQIFKLLYKFTVFCCSFRNSIKLEMLALKGDVLWAWQ